jgi:RND family efflux transporter MFP subunit
MKKIAIIISMFLLLGCGSKERGDTIEELNFYREKVEKYNLKIAALEAEMETGENPAVKSSTLPVEVKTMDYQSFSRYFDVTGVMEAVQDAYISPEINGKIQKVAVKRGSRVNKGDLMIKLDTEVTEKNIEEVKTSLRLADQVFQKQKELWEQKIGSELQYLEAKNAMESLQARLATLEEQLAMASISAPFSGIIDDIMVKEGELATPGMPLVHLLNLATMRVSARISEAFLNSVSRGDLVELRFPTYPEYGMEAQVTRLGQVIDPQTRTFILEVELDNPQEKLKPNLLTSVRIQDFADDRALVVPSSILRQDFNGTFLFRVSSENGKKIAEKVYVMPGTTVQDQTLISEGLSPGDKVITKGFNLVSNGSPVRMTNLEDQNDGA